MSRRRLFADTTPVGGAQLSLTCASCSGFFVTKQSAWVPSRTSESHQRQEEK